MRSGAIESARDGAVAPRVLEWNHLGDATHVVQFYEGEAFLLDALTRFVATGLEAGDPAIVIATKPHRQGLEERLDTVGVDVAAACERGEYVPLDAAETLASISVDGWPDEARFEHIVGGIVARVAACGRRPHVRGFGEMVALLCADGREQAAIRLETLWNDLARRLSFSLFCAYPISTFRAPHHEQTLLRICGQHAHVIPAESYTGLDSTAERLLAVAALQQKAQLLEAELIERRRLEAELQRRLGQLAEADRRKDEFLAMLGHELRNPLAAVRAALETAGRDDAQRTRALGIASRQADQLRLLIDDLLDVARITQGHIQLRKQALSFSGLVRGAIETARRLVEERYHYLEVSLPSEDVQVHADPARLEQVLVNLIGNAAKYTDPGGRIEIVGDDQGTAVSLAIRDNGIGIAPDLLPHVFDLFVQAERAADRSHGGLGIGLTVARRLVELHGGLITVRSEGLGRGSEFVVRLPALVAERDRVPTSAGAESSNQTLTRVLLVEDNHDAGDALMMLLELLGHRVRIARSGADALAAAVANPPDVMLLDIGLPGMDGYELAERIRQTPELKGVVLIALTGYGREEDKRRAMAAGFDYHLVKPVDVDSLQGIVGRIGKPAIGTGDRSTLH